MKVDAGKNAEWRCRMMKFDWLCIAQAAQRKNFVATLDETLDIAREHGVNIHVNPDAPLTPTLQVSGRAIYISITPYLVNTSQPRIVVTVAGNTYPVKDRLKRAGYYFMESAWVKEFKVAHNSDDVDESVIQAVLSAVEEALFTLAMLRER
jgi:hypothetical protein